jgi:hypothetical protein
MYAMEIPEGGPIPTSFRIDEGTGYTIEGEPYEVTEPEELFDEAFEMNIKSFSDRAEFRQKITGYSSFIHGRGCSNVYGMQQ